MFGAPFWKLAVFPESESWSGAKSEAKLRKSTKYPGGRRVNSRYARVFRKIPGILPIWPKIWLILGPNQPQTRLRAQNLTISTEFSREKREEKRGCCREKRKGKQTGCERQTSLSPKTCMFLSQLFRRSLQIQPVHWIFGGYEERDLEVGL